MAETAITTTAENFPTMRKRSNFWTSFFRRLIKEKPLGTVGGVICLILLLVGIFANFLAPYGYDEIHPTDSLARPSIKYPLGTDNLGRDQLSRIIYGARLSVIVGFAATTFSIVISVFIGLTTGYYGGKYDLLVQRIVDAWMCFPGLIILIVAVSFIGPGMWQIIIILGLQYGIAGSRIVRGAVVTTRENMYIEAARSAGATSTRMLLRHILPNIMAPIIILFTTRLGAVILAEASMSFLGLGIPPPAPSWGGMLSGTGRSYMLMAPWIAIFPGIALSIVVYGINVFGDAVRDLLDPRLRGGGGRYTLESKKDKKRKKKMKKQR
ncbi:MAG: ABC transporter permease [Deltaproteobacteria bacterium]|nr:ABC transporter permease [Deltaproteobacteria bacterium]MBW2051112.1 ABC transporter permease [Deltaproteobacteria bacterium]MBW2141394.1 ABC transporter permease [Deltaproteobacteria bacterium]MBW2324151.1 ABC transporter permease [Deltaproteobacteria bacterium]